MVKKLFLLLVDQLLQSIQMSLEDFSSQVGYFVFGIGLSIDERFDYRYVFFFLQCFDMCCQGAIARTNNVFQ